MATKTEQKQCCICLKSSWIKGLAGAFVLTVYPEKSFMIYFDKDFNLTVFDSHIHFTAPPEQLSFESALKRTDCHGMIITAEANQYNELVKYIFRTVIPELRAQDNHGNITVLLSKKLNNNTPAAKMYDYDEIRRKVRNESRTRNRKRANANKSCMWYDGKMCPFSSLSEAVKNHIKTVNNKKLHYSKRIRGYGFIILAEKLKDNGILCLRDAYNIFLDTVKTECKSFGVTHNGIGMKAYKSSEVRDLFMRNLPVILVYGSRGSYIVEKSESINWDKLMVKIDWPVRKKIIQDEVNFLSIDFLKPALAYCTTSYDRNLLKVVLCKLTSKKFMGKGNLGISFNKKSLNHAEVELKNFQFNQTKEKNCRSIRLPGSGRPSFAEQYPDLASIMLSLFDSAGQGLSSHPRLICDTLFLDKKSWIDMPRCVSVLNQVFNIPIKLSTAYTYTENFRSRTKQAKRHHEGKGINPGISLRKSTRDGQKHKSINSHFATASMNYTFENMFNRKAVGIARDNKALVHTDVEIVQRQSKSWKKITYSDHDWEKDKNRTLAITTYQLIERKTESQEYINQLSGIPLSRSQLAGDGISIVKMSFFEKEGAFRHLNETLFVMSEFKEHFLSNKKFATEIIFTVDGGGDERPRNKLTKMLMTLFRRLLDLDRVKVISYAEGDSKLHSVERYHVGENRALSQLGEIDSHAINDVETDENGCFSTSKFYENMKFAAEDAVSRIHGTPYAGGTIKSYLAPNESSWVFEGLLEKKIKEFLKIDITNHRIQNNFKISPKGPIWDKICEMFSITESVKCFTAISIYNEANNPENTWDGHYEYAVYRPDDAWRGKPVNKFEIQPIIDVNLLPDHHYLPFIKAEELVSCFTKSNLPQWLLVPDFFLPSKNINYVIENHRDILIGSELSSFSDMIGIAPEKILDYVHQQEEKEIAKSGRSEAMKIFSNSLCLFTKEELKLCLSREKMSFTREQNNKADLVLLLASILEKKNINLKDYVKNFKY